MQTKSEYIAHVKQGDSGEWLIHSLEDHLVSVAKLASEFAEPFGSSDWAYLLGLWHDLGKYSKEFQSYIRSASGYDPEAHLEQSAGRVDHSTSGAILALQKFGDAGRVLSFPIAGHHAGLTDWLNADLGRSQLSERVKNLHLLERHEQFVPAEILNAGKPTSRPPIDLARAAIWVRMLFSCLVDADFLDTEKFMDEGKSTNRSSYPSLDALHEKFESHISLLNQTCMPTPVNLLRKQIQSWCIQAGSEDGPIFSLTVPTGGGKTLSSLAFAMQHALKKRKRRIIYVIPYTSIVEQTSSILKKIFGDDSVLEHHSNFDPERETPQSRLACENWDAPIIVTTNVQFFESLFAARTSRCRKLHRVAESVVILDEAQLLPSEFLQPIVDVLGSLSECFKTTFVLSTATQPTLSTQTSFFRGLKNVREVIPEPHLLYSSLERVKVTLPSELNEPMPPDQLAAALSAEHQVLCILNRKDECRELYSLMPEGAIHLSGYMCGQHKSEVIELVRRKLKENEPLKVVSTQLVEAGVDFDFPVVYRAMSGLDSIAQAAGRCNREGLLEFGSVRVFVSWKKTPRGHLSNMETAFREIIHAIPNDKILTPEAFSKYFAHLYWIKGKDGLDLKGICEDLAPSTPFWFRFKSAAEKFQIIDEAKQRTVFVRYGKGTELIELLRKNGPERWLLRKLQRFCVSVPIYVFNTLVSKGDVEEVCEGYFSQAFDGLYHPSLGFLGGSEVLIDIDELII